MTRNCAANTASVVLRRPGTNPQSPSGENRPTPRGRGVAIQTFGDYARWHSHLHALVADGLFLQSGYFFVMPKVDIRPLSDIFRAYVLKMPKKEGFLSTSI
jgi:hypothetical protein